MAIKINITAKVANLKQIRSQLESSLKGINVGGGKDTKSTKIQTDNVKDLINKYKALDYSQREFITRSKQEIQVLKQDNSTLALRAKLTQARQAAIKKETSQIQRQANAIQKVTQAKQKENSVSNQARSLKAQYDLGLISLKNYTAEANKLIAINKTNAKELTAVASLQRNVNNAMKAASNITRKKVQQELKEMEISKAKNLAHRQEQQGIAALNRIKKSVVTGTTAKEIASMNAYNAAVKRSIELYKAGKIEAKEFIAITKQLQTQKANLGDMDNKVAAQQQSTYRSAASLEERRLKAQNKINNAMSTQNETVKKANTGFKSYIANLGMIIKKFTD